MPVAIQVQAIGRGDVLRPVSAARRLQNALRVEYRRPTVIERYDVRAAAVEQSFVLAHLPQDTGDLVVRMHFATELAVRAVGDELLLELSDVYGLRVGAVTAIDAEDRRIREQLRHRESALDLVTPAAFVNNAALPLVVDPLIGNVFNVNGVNMDDRDPDVAYDETQALAGTSFTESITLTLSR